MAKRKRELVVTHAYDEGWLYVTCEPGLAERIWAIEGVVHVGMARLTNDRGVAIDVRYNIEDIVAEIEALVTG